MENTELWMDSSRKSFKSATHQPSSAWCPSYKPGYKGTLIIIVVIYADINICIIKFRKKECFVPEFNVKFRKKVNKIRYLIRNAKGTLEHSDDEYQGHLRMGTGTI